MRREYIGIKEDMAVVEATRALGNEKTDVISVLPYDRSVAISEMLKSWIGETWGAIRQ